LEIICKQKSKEEGHLTPSSQLSFRIELLRSDFDDLTAIVVSAGLAGSVGQTGLAAMGASDHAGNGQLPVGAASLVASCFGNLSLGNSHGDTSSVLMPVGKHK
jgi:hypothetical protein